MEKPISSRKSSSQASTFPSAALLMTGITLLLISSVVTLGLVLILYLRGAASVWDILMENGSSAPSSSQPGIKPQSDLRDTTANKSADILVSQTATPSPTPSASSTETQPPTRTNTPTRTITPTRTSTPTAPPSQTPLFPSSTPIPSATPTQLLPAAAFTRAISGSKQVLSLSCEAHVASVWAGYFGASVDEIEFLNRLPRSDNPEKGFVGNPDGVWGMTPPHDYGVHAAPVAALLRKMGVRAEAHKDMSFDTIKSEIAAGRPVIVWVVGHVGFANSTTYRAENGEEVLVAPYEHTVIVTAYDTFGVRILDGDDSYERPLGTFLRSWATLGNMAIIRGN